MKKDLKGLLTLLAVGVMATFQWGCSTNNTTTNNNNNNGIPMSALFPFSTSAASSGGTAGTNASNSLAGSFSSAFNPVFSEVSPFSAGGTGSWAIGMIVGVNADTTQLGGSVFNEGLGMVALSVANQAVSTAGVTLTPNGGAGIPLAYLASTSYNGYNYSWYAAGTTQSPTLPSYQANTSYTMTVVTTGGTSTSSLTAPGGYTYGYNTSNGGVTTTVTSLGTVNAAFEEGISGSNYSFNSNPSTGSPFYNGSWYSLSSPATYISVYESANWTTSMTSSAGLKGGVIAVDLGIAESAH